MKIIESLPSPLQRLLDVDDMTVYPTEGEEEFQLIEEDTEEVFGSKRQKVDGDVLPPPPPPLASSPPPTSPPSEQEKLLLVSAPNEVVDTDTTEIIKDIDQWLLQDNMLCDSY